MSALAMILTAAMVVPGDGPEKVSGEMVQERLDLRGEWEAILFHGGKKVSGQARILRGLLVTWEGKGGRGSFFWSDVPVDEGKGNFRIGGSLGIYQYDGNRLRICFDDGAGDRPTSFLPGKNRVYLILHRVKSSK